MHYIRLEVSVLTWRQISSGRCRIRYVANYKHSVEDLLQEWHRPPILTINSSISVSFMDFIGV